MTTRHPWLLALLAALSLLVAACTDAADPEHAGDAAGAGGGYEATIRRTSHRVAHIVGDSVRNVSFGQGYANAEDHLCTLADQVVKVRGERARYHGPGEGDEQLNSDFGWRHLGLYDRATEDLGSEPTEVRDALAGFVAGWNRYLEETGAENVSGWCAGAPWVQPITETDLYAYARSVALSASGAQLVGPIATAQPPFVPGETTATTAAATEPTADETTDDTTTTTAPGTGDPTTAPPDALTPSTEAARGPLPPEQFGSNGWAIGSDRTEDGTGMLMANPHLPWDGELRLWETHLTVPGELDVYGAQFVGLPGVGIGFTDGVAWTHTVSAGNRFTAYALDVVEGDPTSYRYGDEERAMTPTEHTVEVLGDDGSTTTETRTLWSSHYGPIIDFRGAGWSDQQAITYRDANIDNRAMLSQYLAMDRASDLDELIEVHRRHQGVPVFNTVAVGADGRGWYADTSATPNLDPGAIAAWQAARQADLAVAAAWEAGAVLLDGSDPRSEWVDAEGARSPGLVPFDRMPQLTRTDYVFNANDSYWLANVDEPLDGAYSPLHGLPGTAQSPRTRENGYLLADTSGESPSGEGGSFTLEELQDTILLNRGHTARLLHEDVTERCEGVTEVDVDAKAAEDGSEDLPAASVDVSEACALLADWDGRLDNDSIGAIVWRELLRQYPDWAFTDVGPLWAEPFDASDPIGTPSGLTPAPEGETDPLLINLARAVQTIEKAGWALDAPLGGAQFAPRGDERVALHGGEAREGVPNVVAFSNRDTSTELPQMPSEPVTEVSRLRREGYPVNVGTSFLMTLELTEDGPEGYAFLTYGQSGDPESPAFAGQTERFAEKDWRAILLTDEEIEADPGYEAYTVTG